MLPDMHKSRPGLFQSRRVLIVEDEASLRLALTQNLQALGIDVLQADGAVNAIQILEKQSVDLILSSVRTPAGSARDLLNWLNRYQPVLARTPVILMSDKSEVIEYLSCQLGVEFFLQKPIADEVLTEALRQILKPKIQKRA